MAHPFVGEVDTWYIVSPTAPLALKHPDWEIWHEHDDRFYRAMLRTLTAINQHVQSKMTWRHDLVTERETLQDQRDVDST